MLQALDAGGGGKGKMARHGVAGLLNYAAAITYKPVGVSGPTDLYYQIRSAYLTGTFEPLATNLSNANSLSCPFG